MISKTRYAMKTAEFHVIQCEYGVGVCTKGRLLSTKAFKVKFYGTTFRAPSIKGVMAFHPVP